MDVCCGVWSVGEVAYWVVLLRCVCCGVGCCIGESGLEGLWCVSECSEEHLGGVLWVCLRVRCACCRVEVSVGVLVDVRSMGVGGGGLYMGVGICCSGEGGGRVHRVAVRGLSDACCTSREEFAIRAGEVLLDVFNMCAKWEKACGEEGIGRILGSMC